MATSTAHWFVRWHGERLSTRASDANAAGGSSGGAGSTSMSTGVTLALSSKADLVHSHVIGDVSSLASTLSGLAAAISTKAAGSHTHAQADITGLTSTLANLSTSVSFLSSGLSSKTDIGHTHAIADVTNLASTLANLSTSLSFLSSGLSSKTDIGHTHAATDIASGTVATARLGSGTANNTVFLRGDQTWATPTAAASGVIPSTWATASTDTLTGSTTMQSAVGLSFAVSSASVYRFDFAVGWRTVSTTTGIAFGVNGPSSPTMLAYEWWASSGLGVLNGRVNRGFGVQTLPITGSSAANIDEYAAVRGVLRTGANSGTLQLQFASEVNASTVTVRAGSVGFLYGPL